MDNLTKARQTFSPFTIFRKNMNTTFKLVCILAGVMTLAGSSMVQSNDLKKAAWLLGTWASKSSKGTIYESWSSVNDQAYSGKSYTIRQQDTILFETIQLVMTKDGLDYIPTVQGMNGGMPVRFTSTTVTDTQLTFENPTHDFPQVIRYTLIHPDSLVAEISGITGGQQQKQTFPMKRVK